MSRCPRLLGQGLFEANRVDLSLRLCVCPSVRTATAWGPDPPVAQGCAHPPNTGAGRTPVLHIH